MSALAASRDAPKTMAIHVETAETHGPLWDPEASHDPIVQTFPEGGLRAWAAVFGAALCLFVGGGVSSFLPDPSPIRRF